MTASLTAPVTGGANVEISRTRRRPALAPLGVAILALVLIPTVVFVGADLFGGHLL